MNKKQHRQSLTIFFFSLSPSPKYISYFDLRTTVAWIFLWTTYYWLETMADNNRGGSSTNEITYYLNIENAKILAFCIVCGFVMYHGVLHLKYGKLWMKVYMNFTMKRRHPIILYNAAMCHVHKQHVIYGLFKDTKWWALPRSTTILIKI